MISAMRYRVTISQPALTPDGAGGFSESWTQVATVYAAITPLASGAQLKFGQIEATSTHEVIIRYRTDVAPGMTLTDEDNVIYNIISVSAQQGRKKYLALLTAVRSS